DPVWAHASTRGASRGSSAAIAGASSSYPVRESSGKTTTRVPAARTVAAWVTAFTPTSKGTHSGWATAMVNGSRIFGHRRQPGSSPPTWDETCGSERHPIIRASPSLLRPPWHSMLWTAQRSGDRCELVGLVLRKPLLGRFG